MNLGIVFGTHQRPTGTTSEIFAWRVHSFVIVTPHEVPAMPSPRGVDPSCTGGVDEVCRRRTCPKIVFIPPRQERSLEVEHSTLTSTVQHTPMWVPAPSFSYPTM